MLSNQLASRKTHTRKDQGALKPDVVTRRTLGAGGKTIDAGESKEGEAD